MLRSVFYFVLLVVVIFVMMIVVSSLVMIMVVLIDMVWIMFRCFMILGMLSVVMRDLIL